MEEQETIKSSKYSGALAQIYRLDNLWKEVHSFIKQRLFSRWNETLDTIWSELARDLKEKDYEEKKKEFDKFDSELLLLGQINDSEKAGFLNFTKEELTNRAKQYTKLREKELFLRRLENFLGKGTKWEDDDDDDFG
jgi:hypothetical protein